MVAKGNATSISRVCISWRRLGTLRLFVSWRVSWEVVGGGTTSSPGGCGSRNEIIIATGSGSIPSPCSSGSSGCWERLCWAGQPGRY